MRPFHPRFDDLPDLLPVFPLAGMLLLPDGKMPLNIFEPRYLAMVQDALGNGRLVGVVQPHPPESDALGSVSTPAASKEPPLYAVGCAGRISAFTETDDGRIVMTLTGVCRFHVLREVDGMKGYRRVEVDWSDFQSDLEPPAPVRLDRPRLLAVLKPYLRLNGLDLNWRAIEIAPDLILTVMLPMLCPFEPREKQALLECPTSTERGSTLITLIEMAVAERGGHIQIKQ